jgi:hypothetical protein
MPRGRRAALTAAPLSVVALLAMLAACGTSPSRPAPADLRPITSLPSWEACGKCHQAVYEEWRTTLHAGAWLDPIYRMSAGNPPKMECRGCHSMEPILAREISVEYSYRPIFRDYNHDDGVGCAACHLRADGTVAARRTVPDAPCRPVRDDRITTPEYCGACHNPSHDAYFEWKTSAYARAGVTCNDCHSHPVLRDGKRVGFSHDFPGGNSPSQVRKAIRTETKIEGREVVMTVENLTGHKFPGEVPSRIFLIEILPIDADGNEMSSIDLGIKRPFKTQVGVPDNRLTPDERRTMREKLPDGAVAARVTYFWKPSPLTPPNGWTILARWQGKVP